MVKALAIGSDHHPLASHFGCSLTTNNSETRRSNSPQFSCLRLTFESRVRATKSKAIRREEVWWRNANLLDRLAASPLDFVLAATNVGMILLVKILVTAWIIRNFIHLLNFVIFSIFFLGNQVFLLDLSLLIESAVKTFPYEKTNFDFYYQFAHFSPHLWRKYSIS